MRKHLARHQTTFSLIGGLVNDGIAAITRRRLVIAQSTSRTKTFLYCYFTRVFPIQDFRPGYHDTCAISSAVVDIKSGTSAPRILELCDSKLNATKACRKFIRVSNRYRE